jgi:hypothetical protein
MGSGHVEEKREGRWGGGCGQDKRGGGGRERNWKSSYTVVTEKSIYREYMEVAVFHSEL